MLKSTPEKHGYRFNSRPYEGETKSFSQSPFIIRPTNFSGMGSFHVG